MFWPVNPSAAKSRRQFPKMVRHHEIQYFQSHKKKHSEWTLSCPRYISSQAANIAEPQMNTLKTVPRLLWWPDGDTAGAKDSGERAETFLFLGCEGIKAQGFLCWWSFLGGTSYVTAPWVNWFAEWDIAKGNCAQTGTNAMQTSLKNFDGSVQHEFESSPIKWED